MIAAVPTTTNIGTLWGEIPANVSVVGPAKRGSSIHLLLWPKLLSKSKGLTAWQPGKQRAV